MSSWEERFRAARISLPHWAEDAPDRCLAISNASGVFEAWTWQAGTGELRQATSRPNGTVDVQLSRDGEHIWFFDDTDGDELGTWQRLPFAGGPTEPALDIPAAYDVGLEFGPGGLVAVGSTNADGSVVRVGIPGRPLTEIYRHSEDASLGALSADGTIVVVAHSEGGDSRHPALRAYSVADGSVLADLSDGEGLGLQAYDFAPISGDTRLLVSHERRGRPELLIWDIATGGVSELDIDVPGEINAEWYVDGTALLVGADHEARSRLFRFEVATGMLEALKTPRGTVSGATTRPDGTVWIAWTSAASPDVIRSLPSGDVLLTAPGAASIPPSVPVEDVWVEGPGGRIHALLSLPPGPAPHPAIFHVHGGPESHDEDRFDASVAAWVDHGYAVVQVNYRGSSGYGSAWREAIVGRVGITELEDLAAVRAHLVDTGTIDGARIVLEGGSWGGYLTLLGLGRQPSLWAAGLAIVPVGDYVTAYAEEMEGLQAYDRALFGGTPAEIPEAYRVSSPLTYAQSVAAPVYIAVGENDPRCPAGQVDNYVAELIRLGREHEVYRFDAGHGSLVTDERINQMRRELTAALRWVPTGSRSRVLVVDATFEPVWWTSTFRRAADGAATSGRLAHRLKLGGPSRGDERVQAWLARTRRPALTTFARTVTRLGGGLSPYPALAAIVAATAPAGHRREAVAWSVRRLGSGLLVRFALAQSLRRARPDRSSWLASSSGFSWPSGHTTAMTLTAGLAVEAALGAGLPIGPVLALAAPVPVAIGWSRVYLGVHWPSDVLAGWLLGLALVPLSNLIPARDPFVAGVRVMLARRASWRQDPR